MRHFSAKEVEKILLTDGWYEVKGKGGHKQYKHPVKSGKVTLSLHTGKKLSVSDIKSIERQSGIEF